MAKWVLVLLVVAAIGWLWLRQGHRMVEFVDQRLALKRRNWSLLDRSSTGRYAAVSIVPGQGACDAARAMGDGRLLESEVPALPLPACDVSECNCHYRHFRDRRQEDRRGRARREHTLLLGALRSDRRDDGDRRKKQQ